MIGFTVLLLLAVAFVLPPLLRREYLGSARSRFEQNKRVHAEQLAELQQQLDDNKIDNVQFEALQSELFLNVLDTESGAKSTAELEASVDSNRAIWSAAAIILLLAIASSYVVTGYFYDTKAQQQIESFTKRASDDDESNRSSLLDLLPVIENRVSARPDNLGWRYLLAQMQSQLKRYAEAADSYKELIRADGGNAELWAHYAQALYLSNSRRMTAEVEQALNMAVQLNPHQRTALGLRGMHAFEHEDYALAAQAWGTLLEGLPPNSQQRTLMMNARNTALARLAASNEEPGKNVEESETNPAVLAETTSEGYAERISVSVDVAETAQVASTDAVFVYARAANGPKMPLAIVRLTVADLPAELELHDGLAMMPAMKLSMFEDIEIIARISQNGSATSAPGDWQATSGSLKRQAIDGPLSLLIDEQI